MKRTIGIMLIMVMLFSILGGCGNNSNNSEELPEVANSVAEQVGKSSENATIKNDVTESRMTEDTTTLSSDETTTMANSTDAQTTDTSTNPSKKTNTNLNNSTTPNTTVEPSTSESSTSYTSSSDDTDESEVVDTYVYKDPTVFVDGMYRLGEKNIGYVYMGDVYADPQMVSEIQSYYNWTLDEEIEFDAKHIVTDVNKMPSNYKYYMYIVNTIPNWLYEKGIGASNYIYPASLCALVYESYPQYAENVTWFYDGIGDIDYKSVTADDVRGNTVNAIYDPYKNKPLDMDKLTKYVNYVKENKIKLTTIAEPLLPIVYCKGDYIFIRTKITVNVESSDTDNIKLFLHDDIQLSKGENVIYLDIPMALSDFWGNSYDAKIIYGDLSQYVIS